MTSIPIVRLEVEGMKHAIAVALSDYMLKMDADIQRAIECLCTPENVARIVQESAGKAIKDAITSEIDSFYRYGRGKAAIKKAVADALDYPS